MRRNYGWQWLIVTLATLVLHYAWEMLQAPWFEEFAGVPFAEHALPCLWSACGDLGISAGAYVTTAMLFRRPRWLLEARWQWPSVLWILIGLGATVAFERSAVSVGRWHYTDEMPTVAGIGLAPLLQWLLVPAAILTLARSALVRTVATATAVNATPEAIAAAFPPAGALQPRRFADPASKSPSVRWYGRGSHDFRPRAHGYMPYSCEGYSASPWGLTRSYYPRYPYYYAPR